MARRRPERRPGFEDMQARRAALDVRSLFEAYGFACAFTGRDLANEARADGHGYLLQLGDPGGGDPRLAIPACLDAINAYEKAHLALGPRYEIFVNLEAISPELLETLNPIGRLRLPDDPALFPSQAAITPHLLAFLKGRTD